MKFNAQLTLIHLLALELTLVSCAPVNRATTTSDSLTHHNTRGLTEELVVEPLFKKLAEKVFKPKPTTSSKDPKVCTRGEGDDCGGPSKAEMRKKAKEELLRKKKEEKERLKEETAKRVKAEEEAAKSKTRATEMYGKCPPGFDYRADGKITVSGIDVCWAVIAAMESNPNTLTDPVPITNTAPDGSKTISKVSKLQSWDARKVAEKKMVTDWLNGGGLAELRSKVGPNLAYFVIRGPAHRTTGMGATTQFNGAHLTAVAGPSFDDATYKSKADGGEKKNFLAKYIKASSIAHAPHLYLKNSPTTADKMEMNTEITGSTTISSVDYKSD
jgi:hypothetical protein